MLHEKEVNICLKFYELSYEIISLDKKNTACEKQLRITKR
jgi:hypothetical protein